MQNEPFHLRAKLASVVSTLWRGWRWELLLVGLGLLVSSPLLLFGFPYPTHDGFWHLRWWSNFTAQIYGGELYPRWLMGINYGCGSPTFFYYPPVPYWVSAIFAPMAGYSMPAWRALGWGASLSLILSGLLAFGCLRKLVTAERAFVGAVLYMVMPYHLAIDLLERGAYAECWSFVWMPLILWGILELREEKSSAWLKTAVGFGLLFMTHPPTCVTFTPIAVGLALWRGMKVFVRTLAAGAIGAGLAAVYLVPALTTQASVSTQYLRVPYETAFFFPTLEILKPLSKPDAFNIRVLTCFGLLVVSFFVGYGLLFSPNQSRASWKLKLPWLSLALGAILMMLPLSDPVYSWLPPLQMIQFPWRFLAPASLLVAVLVVLFWPGSEASLAHRWAHGAVCLLIASSIVVMSWTAYARTSLSAGTRFGMPPAMMDAAANDVIEYRPSQAHLEAALAQMGNAKVKVIRGDANVTIAEWRARWIRLETEGTTRAQILVRQFYTARHRVFGK